MSPFIVHPSDPLRRLANFKRTVMLYKEIIDVERSTQLERLYVPREIQRDWQWRGKVSNAETI